MTDDPPPSLRHCRIHAVATAVAVTAILWLTTSVGPIAIVPGAIHLLLALASPAWARASCRVGTAVGRAIGRVVSTAVLVILFAAVVIPIALLLRLSGRDPLNRRPPAQTTAWLPAPVPTPLDRMF